MESVRLSLRAYIRRDDRVLVSEYRDARGLWYVLPGGGQNPGEDAAAGLRREVHEEVGLAVEVGLLRWVREYIADRQLDPGSDSELHQVELIFECSIGNDASPVLGDNLDTEQIGWQWMGAHDLINVRFYPHALAEILNGECPDRLYLGACL